MIRYCGGTREEAAEEADGDKTATAAARSTVSCVDRVAMEPCIISIHFE